MRNLFLALVLSNLAFAAWHAWFAAPPPGRPVQSAAPPIRLVSEIEAERQATGDAAGEGSASQPASGAAALGAAAAEDGIAAGESASSDGVAPGEPDSSAGIAADETASGDGIAAGETATRDGTATVDAAPAGGTAALALPAPENRCVSVGPFAELSEAATASAKLRAAGYDPTQRIGEGDIWVGYWVYIDGIRSRADANATVAALEGAGVTGPYVIPGEQDGDIVSLGVFSEIARAGRLRDQVRGLGYEPEVVDRTRRGTVYWVDVLLGAGQQLDFEALQTRGRITRLEQRPCEAPLA